VEGGRPLSGSVPISGAKNAALKMLAAATLTGERCRITNVPEIEDVRVMAQTLIELGVVVDHPEENVYEVAAGDVEWQFVPLEAAAKMRASFMLLGPLLARFGRVIISNPGGDRIGRRPVNLHVDAMRALGAEIDYRNGYYFATAPGRLRGGEVRFPFVSVMGTENAMLAATLADGHTTIRPAAQEPEVDDLMAFLRKMGAEIERTHPDTIEIHGKRRLREIDRRLGYLAKIMKQAKVVDPAAQPTRDQVRFGATVELADEDDNRRTLTIVGDDEADASNGRIGWNAPLARALVGARIGDERIVSLPGGEKSYEVMAISYPE